MMEYTIPFLAFSVMPALPPEIRYMIPEMTKPMIPKMPNIAKSHNNMFSMIAYGEPVGKP